MKNEIDFKYSEGSLKKETKFWNLKMIIIMAFYTSACLTSHIPIYNNIECHYEIY